MRLRDRYLAVSVQAGRAWTNNGALCAVLAGAADGDSAWLVLLVPDHYKGGVQRVNISAQVAALLSSPGVHLEIEAVAVVGY